MPRIGEEIIPVGESPHAELAATKATIANIKAKEELAVLQAGYSHVEGLISEVESLKRDNEGLGRENNRLKNERRELASIEDVERRESVCEAFEERLDAKAEELKEWESRLNASYEAAKAEIRADKEKLKESWQSYEAMPSKSTVIYQEKSGLSPVVWVVLGSALGLIAGQGIAYLLSRLVY